ncbi:MAG: hydrogenase formation protein HypD [Candidatus Verstraetearchaeota archaeon]|nr:hydrogenase formation protein HypD [Candidatus Verstraetearchaeota archaeon]
MLSKFRDRELVRKVTERILEESRGISVRIMHVCGTHEWTITHFGIRDLLPENIEVVAGPGCPVCVTPGSEIDLIAELSQRDGVIVTTFGDVIRVPGTRTSLSEAKTRGGDVRLVYGIEEAVRIARQEKGKEVVHFSIGFETTAPMAAVEILKGPPENFSIFSTHKLIPPAMEFLLKSGLSLDGFICPGHVSTIIGVRPYRRLAEKYRKPMVVAGFEPLDVMLGILSVVRQIRDDKWGVENEYTRAVREEGNVIALKSISEVFEVADAWWRGIGRIESSGLRLRGRFKDFDVVSKFGLEVPSEDYMPEGCGCGEVLKGVMKPEDCPLFGKECTPNRPIGPCMVSLEGTCSIVYKYRRFRPKDAEK